MDYSKRNKLRTEIEILTERVIVLQEQEKSYKNLEKELSLLRLQVDRQTECKNNLESDIKTLRSEINAKEDDIKNLEGNKASLQKDIESNKQKKQREIELFERQRETTRLYIEETDRIKKERKEQMKRNSKEFKQFIDSIRQKEKNKVHENELLEKQIKDNKMIIEQQEYEIQSNKSKIKDTAKEFNELDTAYQELLETYIIKE